MRQDTPLGSPSRLAALALLGGLAVLAPVVGSAQSATSVGVLDFRDQTRGEPTALGRRLAADVRAAIATGHADLVPRTLAEGDGDAAAAGWTVERLTGLGRRYGVEFVLHGDLLSVSRTETASTVVLAAQLIGVETGLVRSLRAEGVGAAADATGGGSPLERAATQAVGRLVEAVAAEIRGAARADDPDARTNTNPGPVEPPEAEANAAPADVPQAEDGETAQQDEELQQLVADAEAALSAGGLRDADVASIESALDGLSAALRAKSDLLARGENTDAADARVAELGERLRATLASAAPEQTEPAAPARADVLAAANETADEALGLLQKIKDARALLWGRNDEEQATSEPDDSGPVGEGSTGEITGIVVDERGPVGGAEVVDEETGIASTTDEDGAFVLHAIPFHTVARLSVVADGKRSTLAAVPVVGARATVADVRLRKDAAVLKPGVLASTACGRAGRGTGGLVTGRIVDAGGRPLARAVVSMKAVGVVRTDSSGEYVFRDVPPGTQRLSVLVPGMKTASAEVRVVAARTARADLRVAAAPPLPMRPSALLRTAKDGATLSGRVRDQRGRAVAGARVSAIHGTSVVGTFAGREGTYRIAGLRPDEYRVVVSRPGYEGARETLRLSAGERETRDFELRQLSGAVDELRAASQPSQSAAPRATPSAPARRAIGRPEAPALQPAALRGWIFDQRTRRPLAGVTVSVEGIGSTRTDGNGVFRFTHVPPGSHRVIATRGGYGAVERGFRVQAGQTVTLDLGLLPAPPHRGAPTRRR